MKAHRNNSERPGGFENVNASKICRYFRRGYCAKGSQCEFKHSQAYKNYAPACNQGPGCRFLSQNRCSFFHQGVGVQKPRKQQDFQYGSMKSRPPMSIWMEY